MKKKLCRRRYRKREKEYKVVRDIMKPCYEFDGIFQEYDEEAAKQTLIKFFTEFKKIKPHTIRELSLGTRFYYYSFFMNMIPLQAALRAKNYSLACHELITLERSEPILQKRIYNSLLLLYRKYLEE